MPNVTILPPSIGSGSIYFGDLAGEEELPAIEERSAAQRQADQDATAAHFRRVAALQAERRAEMERGQLPFEDVPGVYKPVWRGNELAMEIDPNAMAAAQQAVEAATQFQGIRGYQQALAEGKTPQQALSQFAPLIFNKKYLASLAAGTQQEVHNIGGVGYVQDPSSGQLVSVTPPRPEAGIVNMDVGGTQRQFLRQPSGTMIEVKPQEDKGLSDLQKQAERAQIAFEQAKIGLAKARAVGVEDGKETTPDATKVAQAQAALDATGTNLRNVRRQVESRLATQRGPVTAPVTEAKTPSQKEASEALKQAGNDRTKAREILKKAGFKVE